MRISFEGLLRFGNQEVGVRLEFEADDHSFGGPAFNEGFEEFGDGIEVDHELLSGSDLSWFGASGSVGLGLVLCRGLDLVFRDSIFGKEKVRDSGGQIEKCFWPQRPHFDGNLSQFPKIFRNASER